MGMGKPVISIGIYDVFVKNDVTGYLFSEYQPADFAQKIIDLVRSPEKVRLMGQNAQQIIENQCDPFQSSSQLTGVWNEVAHERNLTETDLIQNRILKLK